MDRNSGQYYEGNPGEDYETPWNLSTTRETETSGRPSLEARPHLRFSCQGSERSYKLLSLLAASLRKERAGRFEAQGASRTNPAFVEATEKNLGRHPSERAFRSHLFNGSSENVSASAPIFMPAKTSGAKQFREFLRRFASKIQDPFIFL